MNLTVFLGAGFSAPFGHPVMGNFLDVADRCTRLTEEDRDFLKKLVLQARKANSFLESSPTNIEDILSFSVMSERLDLEAEVKEKTSDRLRAIIQKIYTQIQNVPEYWDKYHTLGHLIGGRPSEYDGKLTFITTNYDLNIESACYSLQTQLNPGFAFKRPEIQNGLRITGQLYGEGDILLYKLHGSVNWHFLDDNKYLELEDRIVVLSGGYGDEKQRTLPYACTRGYESPSAPVIVPPTFLKPELPEALKEVWKGAAKALRSTHVLAFVGYSFPPSDNEMMYFLATALADNPNLRAVHILDIQANAIVSRLRGSGSKIGSHFRALLNPKNDDWRSSTI